MRFRYKLSTLVAVMSLVAIVSVEARWQHGQRQLQRQSLTIGAKIKYVPRSRFGHFWSYLIASPCPQYIASVELTAYQAKSVVFPSPVVPNQRLEQYLTLPAIQDLNTLSLKGTQITDESVGLLSSLTGVEQLRINMTAMTQAGAARLQENLPKCDVEFGPSNGDAFFDLAHSEMTAISRDVRDFNAAAQGDPDAVARLLHLKTKTECEPDPVVIRTLMLASSESCTQVLIEGMHDTNPSVRATALAALSAQENRRGLFMGLRDKDVRIQTQAVRYIGSRNDFWAADILSDLVDDPDSAIRAAVVEILGKLQSPEATAGLIAAAKDKDPAIRRIAMHGLAKTAALAANQTLMAGLQDSDPTVRVAAAQSLQYYANRPTLKALTDATRDTDINVRAAALRSMALVSAEKRLAPPPSDTDP